jgi:competence ComEA-like helix-hairpin-helix protein
MRSRWLYDLQSRLALTAAEATAILALTGALALGLGVRQFQGRAAPPADALVAADARWAALDAAAASADSAAAPVPDTELVAPTSRSPRPLAGGPVRMNLNAADAALLQRLPRIGPALAGRIVAYRQEHGPFRRVEDVVNVRGVGPKTLEQIAPWLYVE